MASLTHKEMRAALAKGGSIVYQGRLISNADQLPTVAELAASDEEKAAAQADLQAQLAAIQAQLAQLTGGQPAAEEAQAVDPKDSKPAAGAK